MKWGMVVWGMGRYGRRERVGGVVGEGRKREERGERREKKKKKNII